MLSRILLIRHGQSAQPRSSTWLDASGYQRWLENYDQCGIDPAQSPLAALVEAVAAADIVASSVMPRAIESAQRLAAGRTIHQSALMSEAPLPIPALPGIRLPVSGWEALLHMYWSLMLLRGKDPTLVHLERARAAIAWLQSVDAAANTAAAVTHGVFRRLLALELLRQGWTAAAPNRSYKCWSAWTFVRSATSS